MKNLHLFDRNRVDMSYYYGSIGDGKNGVFEFNINGKQYFAVASVGGGWDHVSISTSNEVPSVDMMETFKQMFFKENETVVEYHPKKSEYVNNFDYCLHLWRPNKEEMKLPDSASLDYENGDNKVEKEQCKIKGNQIIIYKILSNEWKVVKIVAEKPLNWEALCKIKKVQFGENVAAIQIHSQDIAQDSRNMYICCPTHNKLLTPPTDMVGYKDVGLL